MELIIQIDKQTQQILGEKSLKLEQSLKKTMQRLFDRILIEKEMAKVKPLPKRMRNIRGVAKHNDTGRPDKEVYIKLATKKYESL